jgi:hypothetical protein
VVNVSVSIDYVDRVQILILDSGYNVGAVPSRINNGYVPRLSIANQIAIGLNFPYDHHLCQHLQAFHQIFKKKWNYIFDFPEGQAE